MTRPRSVPFRAVEVHRPVPGRDAPRPTEAPGKLRFADLLRARRGHASSPAAVRPGAAVDALSDDDAARWRPTFAADDEPAAAEDDDPATGTDSDTEPPAWGDTVVPTPASLSPMLGRAPGVGDPPAHPLVAYLGKTVARFCNERAVDHSEGWQVRIPLRPEVLPDTTLELTVSPHWLQLRFEARDPRSRALLASHRDALVRLLDQALQRRREIAISVD